MHYFWGMARNFSQEDRGLSGRLRSMQMGVFAEDIVVLEAQQKSIDANPAMKLQAYKIDQGGVRARQIIERLRAAEEAGPQ